MKVFFKNSLIFFIFSTAVVSSDTLCSDTKLSPKAVQARKAKLAAVIKVFKQYTKKPIVTPAANPPKAPANMMTQTEAYMHRFQKEISALWKKELNTYDALIKKMIAREKEHVTDYYVFYHAHASHIRLIHDVIKELYRFFFRKPAFNHFKVLRFWNDASPYKTPNDFLTHYKKDAFSLCFDRMTEIAPQVLSVNLSLFGNRTLAGDKVFAGECSFTYFLKNTSHIANWFDAYLPDLFKRLGIKTKYADRLMKLKSKLIAPDKTGQILQIFIPKKDIDTYIYPSHYSGVPHKSIAAAAANITFDKKLKRHTSITPILESYQNKPFEMNEDTYDRLQARLLLNAEVFKPESKIITYRYSSLPKTQLTAYKNELRTIVSQALEEWCNTYAATKTLPIDLEGTAIDVLLKDIK